MRSCSGDLRYIGCTNECTLRTIRRVVLEDGLRYVKAVLYEIIFIYDRRRFASQIDGYYTSKLW